MTLRSHLAFVMAVFLTGAGANAQHSQLAASIDSAMAEGTAESLSRALTMRHKLDSIYTIAGDQRQRGVQLNGIGNIYYMLGANDSALVYYRRAAEARSAASDMAGLGRTLGNLGNIYSIVGPIDSALNNYRSARAIAQTLRIPADESAAVGNLSGLFFTMGQLDSAMSYGLSAIVLYRQVGDRQGEGQTLHNLAQTAWARGLADSARSLERQALAISAEIGDRTLRAAVLMNMASIYNSLGEGDSALAYGVAAFDEYKTGGDVRGQALALNNIGTYLSEIGQFDSAAVVLRSGLALSRSANDRASEARALTNLGTAAQRMRKPDSAFVYYSMALPLRREMEDKSGEAMTLSNMASIVGDRGMTDSALVLARRAAALFKEAEFREGQSGIESIIAEVWEAAGKQDSAFASLARSLAIAREIGNRREEARALASMARVAMNLNDAVLAQFYFDSAAVARTTVSRRTGSDFNRVSFADSDTDLFNNWTLLWLQRKDVDSQTAAAASLAAYEKGRAQALLDLMGDSTAQAHTPDMSGEGLALARSGGGSFVSYGVIGDSILVWHSRDGESVRLSIVPVKRATLTRLVSDLRSSLGAEPVSDRSPIIARSGGIAQRSTGTWNTQARQLADLLLPREVLSTISGARAVTIIPAGELALVPFSLLIGDAVPLRYAPSLGSLRAIRSSARTRSTAMPLVIGDPQMPAFGSAGLPQLPAAREEAAAVARALGTRELTGSEATESVVRARIAGAPVVHLATHGLAYSSRDQNRKSFVALASDASHDGLLTVGEILDDPSLRLAASLVVLSACETAVGTVSEAEGTIGFQRALFAKGSRGLLLSLWKVSDEATSLLMRRFYTHWRGPRKVTAAEALRRAQQEVRATRGFEHPRFWSAFQLAGDPD